jgi:hypothetical protein
VLFIYDTSSHIYQEHCYLMGTGFRTSHSNIVSQPVLIATYWEIGSLQHNRSCYTEHQTTLGVQMMIFIMQWIYLGSLSKLMFAPIGKILVGNDNRQNPHIWIVTCDQSTSNHDLYNWKKISDKTLSMQISYV